MLRPFWFGVVIVATSVIHEEMDERTGEENDPGKGAEKMCAVLGQEKERGNEYEAGKRQD